VQATTPEFEAALGGLLRSYSAALKTAGDLPDVGRCRVRVVEAGIDELDDPVPTGDDEGRCRWRWVARFPTRLYVETHIRRQLRHLVRCLDDELLSALPLGGEDRLSELREQIGRRISRPLSWTSLRGIFVRIPPVAAALPLITAALGDPFAVTSRGDLVRSVVVLASSALLIYLLVVWPSLRLGFRVKRAIFSGGVDLARPFWSKPGKTVWLGVPAPREIQKDTALDRGVEKIGPGIARLIAAVGQYWARLRKTAPGLSKDGTAAADPAAAERFVDDDSQAVNLDTTTRSGGAVEQSGDGPPRFRPFPAIAVYRDENVVFAMLGRRKREEPPLGLVLSPGFYLIVLIGVAMPVLLIDYLTSGDVEASSVAGICFVMLIVELMAIQIGLQAWRNYRAHQRRWDERPTDSVG
jgi:hypothetical protein